MKIIEEPGMGTCEIFPLKTSETILFELCKDVFERGWKSIYFGVDLPGAVYEIRAPNAPKRISLVDGYLTIDFGSWHFHLCIGEFKGSVTNPLDPDLARARRTARAEFYRRLAPDGNPSSWGIRLFNGGRHQQLNVFLPNPFLSDDGKIASEPDWTRLSLWDRLRKDYLGLSPDKKDRAARTFFHG